MSGVLDDQSNIVFGCKFDGGRDVGDRCGIHSISRICANCAATGRFTCCGIDRRACLADGIAESHGIVGLEVGTGPVSVNGCTCRWICGCSRVARYGNWCCGYKVTSHGGIQ